MLIDRPPQVVDFPIDFKENLVKMPFVACLRTSSTQLVRIMLAKLLAPLTDRFVGQHDAAGSHELFNITITEREPKVQPHSMADNFTWKAMALIGRGSWCVHAPMIPQLHVHELAVCLT